jgi:hypothetical protein
MKIMMDFHGGPLDGSVNVERELKGGESISFMEMAVIIAGVTSNFQYNVGHRFGFPSPGWLARTVVHRDGPPAIVYEITQREQDGDELIVVVKLVE